MRRAVSVAVTGSALLAGIGIQPAGATAAEVCTSASDEATGEATARRLGDDIRNALRGRYGTISIAVNDRELGIRCRVGAGRHYDSASVVKVTILGALLRHAIEQGRLLTAREDALATKMITRSDNDAASALWRRLGRTRLQRFLDLAGMTRTVLAADGHWGLTQITAADQMRLLGRFTRRNPVLTDRSREYGLTLMNAVVPSQRWGVPAGAPAGVTVYVKNGWLPRSTHGWRVHSIGGFDDGGLGYRIVVLTHDNPSMAYGVKTIELVAQAVHRALNPGQRAVVRESTPDPTWEIPDERIPGLP
ncbi:serine hydrolase [Actinomadura alba]|uniref:Serine hydrolase n=1 Tax=Actinomadura alba TaxID=406431 RepID=A0ABR7M3V4_9ACTN|nr:serine hydrolase [Actinomadura alba]MBC6471387.1 serine hydrolase [Actinomadura alba]